MEGMTGKMQQCFRNPVMPSTNNRKYNNVLETQSCLPQTIENVTMF
jgi:hypothetical protein